MPVPARAYAGTPDLSAAPQNLFDLLVPLEDKSNLRVVEDAKRGVICQNLEEVLVNTPEVRVRVPGWFRWDLTSTGASLATPTLAGAV